jgi:hypothetical protein
VRSVDAVGSYFFQFKRKIDEYFTRQNIKRNSVLPYTKLFKTPIDILALHVTINSYHSEFIKIQITFCPDFQNSKVPIFQYSTTPTFHHSIIPSFQYPQHSKFPPFPAPQHHSSTSFQTLLFAPFHHPSIPTTPSFHYSIIPTFQVSTIPAPQHPITSAPHHSIIPIFPRPPKNTENSYIIFR